MKIAKSMIETMDELFPFSSDDKEKLLSFIDPSKLIIKNGLLAQTTTPPVSPKVAIEPEAAITQSSPGIKG